MGDRNIDVVNNDSVNVDFSKSLNIILLKNPLHTIETETVCNVVPLQVNGGVFIISFVYC